jgi:colanic acid biosynthesis glycosyl transferase WcaI
MRVLIHGINYAPELIGIGRYTGGMASWLASRGHQVTVLTAFPFYPQWRIQQGNGGLKWLREWQEGVEVLRAPLFVPYRVSTKTRLIQELTFGGSCLGWWPHLFRRRWDSILAVCPPLQMGLMPWWLSRRQGVPFIFHVQDLQVDLALKLGLLRQNGLSSWLPALEGWLLRKAAAITTISQGMAARLEKKGVPAARISLLPNWADLEDIRPLPRENPLSREFGLTSNIVVLYAGNLGEKQGLETVLECASLTRKDSRLQYVVAGEGASKDRLLKLAGEYSLDNLVFLSLQSKDRFPFLLAAGDIHLVVQKEEAGDLVMPSKLANILAAGRPFIASAWPETELARVAAASRAGVLVPPGDASALAQAVFRLTEDQETLEAMGVRGRRYAETHLERDGILQRLEELLHQL